MPHGHANLGETTPRSVFYAQGRFGRLFPTLPPFAADTPSIRDALAELGAAGGPMDPGDDLSDPVTLVTDPARSLTNPDNPADLRGGRRPPRRFIDWQTFFDFGDGRVRPNKKIDTKLSSVLFRLLGQPEGEPSSLATRNLLRNLTMEVPSGQRVARAMQLPELAPGDLQDLEPLHLERRTPLWFYVLREAEVTAGGEHLGPVGGRIVAEVIVGLIRGDRQSYLRQDPDFTPTYGSGGDFAMVDLLQTAGVVGRHPLKVSYPAQVSGNGGWRRQAAGSSTWTRSSSHWVTGIRRGSARPATSTAGPSAGPRPAAPPPNARCPQAEACGPSRTTAWQRPNSCRPTASATRAEAWFSGSWL
jgi:hypothetical protein